MDLVALVKAAQTGGASVVDLPQGRYHIEPTVLNNLNNIVLDGHGAVLVGSNFEKDLLILNRCKNVTLKNFSIDYDPLPFTQGTVVSKATDGVTFDVELQKGYPEFTQPYFAQIHLFDPKTKSWKARTQDLYTKMILIQDSKHVRLGFPGMPAETRNRIAVGDYMVFNQRRGSAVVIKDLSEKIRVENITILTSPGGGVIERYALGNDYFQFVVRPGPRPAGAEVDRLLSTGGDALNIAAVRQGPTIEKCDFSCMGDDSVNLHGPLLDVEKVEGPRTLCVAYRAAPNVFPFEPLVKVGDKVRLLRHGDYSIKAESKIVSFKSVKLAPEEAQAYMNTWLATSTVYKPIAGIPAAFEVQLDTDVPAEAGDTCDFPASLGSGFVIRDNYFHDHRSRGIRIASTDGIIENNRFERLRDAAISLGPQYGHWREAGWCSNITIRGNTIHDVALGDDILRNPGWAAICTIVRADKDLSPAAGLPADNTDLVIENNHIDGCSVEGIALTAARNTIIRNNDMSHLCSVHAPESKTDHSGIKLSNTTNIKLENNRAK